MTSKLPKALAFDVFGTVVDWRSSIARESTPWLEKLGRVDLDPHAFADGWRGRYMHIMRNFQASGRAFVVLDILHREMLDDWLAELGIDPASIGEDGLAEWNRAWHRLAPWPDSSAGLARLKTRFPIVTLSNGNVALMLAMARHAGLPWDAILGAEFTRSYKPSAQTYLGSCAALGLEPGEVCLVAAHHSDLAAARALGMMTAYVDRPQEYGGAPAPDAHAAQAWDYDGDSFHSLADSLGCE